jgi:hypothetical protein
MSKGNRINAKHGNEIDQHAVNTIYERYRSARCLRVCVSVLSFFKEAKQNKSGNTWRLFSFGFMQRCGSLKLWNFRGKRNRRDFDVKTSNDIEKYECWAGTNRRTAKWSEILIAFCYSRKHLLFYFYIGQNWYVVNCSDTKLLLKFDIWVLVGNFQF